MTAQAQEDGQAVEASPPPMEAVESHPATLATEAQARAMAQALYSKALRTEMADGFSEALPLYLNVLKVDPHFIDLQIKVAHYYLQENDSGRALELLEKAAAVNPQSAEIQATMAGLLQNSGRFDQALASAHAALALQPENAEAHRVVFEVLRDLNRLPEALANAKAVPQIKCSNPRIWMELARTYLEIICASTNITKEDLSALISPIYERAFALGDPSAELLAQRADYSLFVGKKEEALQYFERATEKGEPNAELYIRLAHLQSDLGHNKEALKSYEAAYDLSPDLPLLREQLAYQYVLDGQEQKAIDFLEAILRKSPTRAGVYAALGDLYQQAKQLDKAEQNYHEAIILDSSNFMNYYKMAGLMLGERRLNEAANLLTEARNRFPANARVAFIAAIVQRELKNSQQALDLFAQAKILADDKDNDFPYADYFYELSLAQEEAGKPRRVRIPSGKVLIWNPTMRICSMP